jgi:acetyltransferase-like isoleucine patch superfamily enzyme
MKLINRIFGRLQRYFYYKIKYKNQVDFDFSVNIRDNSTFEGANRIGKNSQFQGQMGFGSYTGNNCVLFGKIGRFTSISPFVTTNIGRHPFTEPFVSTHQVFYHSGKLSLLTPFVEKQKYAEYVFASNDYPIIIGNDCWIGQGVFIVSGVTISDGAVVLAHAVVTKDVPPYAVVGGVPAKILKYRYDAETINLLLNIQWWNKDVGWLKQHADLFCNMKLFKDYFLNGNDNK